MNDNLKSKIVRRLDDLPDDMGRQVLDYLEFLESKYNLSRRSPSTVQRLAENIEDRIGIGSVSDMATKGAAQVAEAASKMMEGLAAAGRVVADELTPAPSENGEEEAGDAPTDEKDEKAEKEEAGDA
jgi:hypothetical protein